jgi:hypothetical protein
LILPQEAEVNMCVEQGSIALLLGNTDQALKELGLTPQAQQQAGSNPTQQAAQQYVLVSELACRCSAGMFVTDCHQAAVHMMPACHTDTHAAHPHAHMHQLLAACPVFSAL